jgi:hypothetical protein
MFVTFRIPILELIAYTGYRTSELDDISFEPSSIMLVMYTIVINPEIAAKIDARLYDVNTLFLLTLLHDTSMKDRRLIKRMFKEYEIIITMIRR